MNSEQNAKMVAAAKADNRPRCQICRTFRVALIKQLEEHPCCADEESAIEAFAQDCPHLDIRPLDGAVSALLMVVEQLAAASVDPVVRAGLAAEIVVGIERLDGELAKARGDLAHNHAVGHAHLAGHAAALDGMPESANPNTDPALHEVWAMGWQDGRDDLELAKLRVSKVDTRDLVGHIVIDGRRWSTPIVHGSKGSAFLYHAFLWSFKGDGNTPEEALTALREEMLSVAVEDRDTPGYRVGSGAPEVEVAVDADDVRCSCRHRHSRHVGYEEVLARLQAAGSSSQGMGCTACLDCNGLS